MIGGGKSVTLLPATVHDAQTMTTTATMTVNVSVPVSPVPSLPRQHLQHPPPPLAAPTAIITNHPIVVGSLVLRRDEEASPLLTGLDSGQNATSNWTNPMSQEQQVEQQPAKSRDEQFYITRDYNDDSYHGPLCEYDNNAEEQQAADGSTDCRFPLDQEGNVHSTPLMPWDSVDVKNHPLATACGNGNHHHHHPRVEFDESPPPRSSFEAFCLQSETPPLSEHLTMAKKDMKAGSAPSSSSTLHRMRSRRRAYPGNAPAGSGMSTAFSSSSNSSVGGASSSAPSTISTATSSNSNPASTNHNHPRRSHRSFHGPTLSTTREDYGGLRASLDAGMAAMRRWIRSRNAAGAATAGSGVGSHPSNSGSLYTPRQLNARSSSTATWLTSTAASTSRMPHPSRHHIDFDSSAVSTLLSCDADHDFDDSGEDPQVVDVDDFFGINTTISSSMMEVLAEEDEPSRQRAQSEPNVGSNFGYDWFSSTSSSTRPNCQSHSPLHHRQGIRQHSTGSSSTISHSHAMRRRRRGPRPRRRAFTADDEDARHLSSSAAAALYTQHQPLLCAPVDPNASMSAPLSTLRSPIIGQPPQSGLAAVDWRSASSLTHTRPVSSSMLVTPTAHEGNMSASIHSTVAGRSRVVVGVSITNVTTRPRLGPTTSTAATSSSGLPNISGNTDNSNSNNSSTPPHEAEAVESAGPAESEQQQHQADRDRLARLRWIQINRRFQLVITVVALLFSLLLFAILICWVVLTSAYVVSFDKPCDVPLKAYFWLVTLQLVLDVFRNDIMRLAFNWDASSNQRIPCRVIAYNIAYLIYSMLVMRLGVRSVFVNDGTCQRTAPELFNATVAFISLSIAAWGVIVCGYLLPFCVVATMLTYNGYNPSSTGYPSAARGTTQPVFPAAYTSSGAPPGCIDQMPTISMNEFPPNYPRECCICMEEFRPEQSAVVVRTVCNHVFHKQCCREWLRQASTCPVCRTDIPSSLPGSAVADDGGLGSGTGGDRRRDAIGLSAAFSPPQSRIPLGPTGRPVVGLFRMLQSQHSLENDSTSATPVPTAVAPTTTRGRRSNADSSAVVHGPEQAQDSPTLMSQSTSLLSRPATSLTTTMVAVPSTFIESQAMEEGRVYDSNTSTTM